MTFEGEGTPLDPGRYVYGEFEPPMTFAVGSGWMGGHITPEFFDVQRQEGVLLGFARPTFVMGADGAIEVNGLDAREAIRAITSIDGIDAGPVRDTTIDGRPAFLVHLRTETGAELFGGEEGSFTTEPGSMRMLGVDVDGILVLVIEHIWAEPRGPMEPMTQAVIDSVRFETRT